MKYQILFALIITGCCWQCNTNEHLINEVSLTAEPHEHLSDYHFFVGNINELQPNKGVLPYDLNTPLFSDYAEKSRFVWMPAGKSASYREKEVLDFPEGTVLIKTFYYPTNAQEAYSQKQLMETRLLVKRMEDWESISYVWNEAQTDAKLEIVGDIKKVSWINQIGEKLDLDYVIPNRNQCKGCHYYDGEIRPIGPKVRNLNKNYTYEDGIHNQLDKWSDMGYLTGYDASKSKPKNANWDDENSGSIHERAMAYLDINCGHCHNPHGPANTTGLNLIAEQEKDINLGIYKAPVAAGKGSGGFKYSIDPGHPETSIMVYRMESTDPGAMMPELGRRMVHQEGVELIKQWIKEM